MFRFGSSNYAMYNTSNKQPGLFMSSAFRGHNSLTSSNPNNAALYHQNPLALQPSPVSNFLAQLGLNQYENLLLMTGIQTLEDLQRLSNEDLKDIGIRSSKHRKRIVQSCVRLSITGVKQTVNLDYNSSYQSSSLNTKSWNGSQMSPENPREQLMSQYVWKKNTTKFEKLTNCVLKAQASVTCVENDHFEWCRNMMKFVWELCWD